MVQNLLLPLEDSATVIKMLSGLQELQEVCSSINHFVDVDSFIKKGYRNTKFIHLKKALSML